MPLPGLNFGGGGQGGFNFGDFEGGDIRGGPVNIDARTTTGGGDPELIGQLMPIGLIVAAVVVVALFVRRK